MQIQFLNRETAEVLLTFEDDHIFESAFAAVLAKTYFANSAIRAGYLVEIKASVDNERGSKSLSRNTLLVLYNIITNTLTQNFAKAMCSSMKVLHDDTSARQSNPHLSDVAFLQTAHLSKLLGVICEAIYGQFAITMTVRGSNGN